MNHSLLFLLLIFCTVSCKSQDFEKVSITLPDVSNLYVNDGSSTELFYLKLVPEQKIKGAVVILPGGGENLEDVTKQITLPESAYQNDLLTIIPSINWGTEDKKAEIEMLDQIFKEVVSKYNIPKENFILGGFSNGGVIALTYTRQAVKEQGSTYLIPKGVFGLDVPLDKAHFYEYCQREIKRNFSEAGIGEARWMLNRYNQIYGGSPEEYPEKYIEASVYSNGTKNGGNARYLKNIPIRMYTDLDVNWLMNERRRDLYDWNGTDIVAMINDLKLMGNPDASVIISMGKGVRPDGTKHPHSWSVLDTQDCMSWILKLLKN